MTYTRTLAQFTEQVGERPWARYNTVASWLAQWLDGSAHVNANVENMQQAGPHRPLLTETEFAGAVTDWIIEHREPVTTRAFGSIEAYRRALKDSERNQRDRETRKTPVELLNVKHTRRPSGDTRLIFDEDEDAKSPVTFERGK